MGIGEQHRGRLTLVSFYFGDAPPWRRPVSLLGDALS